MLLAGCRASHAKQSPRYRVELPYVNERGTARFRDLVAEASTLASRAPLRRSPVLTGARALGVRQPRVEHRELLRRSEVHPLAVVELPAQPSRSDRTPERRDERKAARRAICE